jgi:putative transposase
LVGLSRASYYRWPASETPFNLRLMQIMGLQALYPQPNTSMPRREHKQYPIPLSLAQPAHFPPQSGLECRHYLRAAATGVHFMYLVAVIDWFSRFVLAWQLSNTLDGAFCLTALHLAFQWGQPDIFNTDQGAQFTAHDFSNELEAAGVRLSMDGRGRAFDNIFIERLWRTVKYEDIDLKEYETVSALEAGLTHYFHFYNHHHQRPHQSLQYCVPAEVHFGF